MNEKGKKRFILWAAVGILTVVSVIVMYRTHRAVPFMMDDEWYSTKLSSEEPITNLHDIIESQIWHYLNWGGRSMTHGILQLTLLAGEDAADILNVAVTLLLGVVICMTAGVQGKKGKFFGHWAAVSMLLGLNANWKMSMFWQAGAANYLYITVFVLLFLWCYLREIPEEGQKYFSLPCITLWIVPLGILAGWSNENMGPAVWLISLGVIWLAAREHRRIAPWMILGNLSCLFGSVMMILAPGNFVRSAQVPENQYGLLWRVFLRCYGESKGALEYLFPVLLCLVMTLFIGKGVLKQPLGRKNQLLLLCALLSWGAMLLSPHYPDRATFGTMTLVICVIVSLWRKILKERENLLFPAFFAGSLIWLRGMFFLGEFLAISWGWIA
ncbi:MAG: DUF6056 family protein [Lachnoclostridium sp.]|nr:DUF6056 family protein [Lachnospira sp.]MCM1248964.1 DUF6056 family protein [Lachnoclostridium sp.]MCM1535176.1 DUF6056 family protein [Clostridium sp.]